VRGGFGVAGGDCRDRRSLGVGDEQNAIGTEGQRPHRFELGLALFHPRSPFCGVRAPNEEAERKGCQRNGKSETFHDSLLWLRQHPHTETGWGSVKSLSN